MATRIGDVPPGLTVADPATVPAAAPTSAPPPAVAGPVLYGTYRLDFDDAKQTANGDPTTGSGTETAWWAFRSLCTSSGCVATGTLLDNANQQEATGTDAEVLHFIDGQWQHTPSLQSVPCSSTNQTRTDTETVGWSLEPQPDTSLRGVQIQSVLTNKCGNQGTVYRTPLSATRTGDVPATVIVADPVVFEAAPASPTTPRRAGG
jgi:hypothetical protein